MSPRPKSIWNEAELGLASRLETYGVRLFDGLTTTEQRRERARHAIQQLGLTETLGEAFAASYQQPLDCEPTSPPLNGSHATC